MNEFYFVVFVLIAASFWMYAIITAMTHQNSMGEKLVIILKKNQKIANGTFCRRMPN